MSFAATILALSLGLTDCLHARTWTNAQGRTVEAEFDHEEGANVVLKLTNGKSVPVPLATLSSADQAFVASTRKPTPPVAPVAPPPEPVPPPDKFPVFDFGLATTGGSTNEGRVIQLWDALKVTTPKSVERVAFEKSLRFMLGGQRLAEHLGFSKTTLASKELPLTISVFSTAAETGKAARYSQPCPHFLKDDGRMFFSATFANLLSGAEAETGDGDLAPSNVVDSQHRNALGGALCAQRDLLPSWLYEAARQYGQMLPWEEQWPQYSKARIAMKKFLSQVAERKAFLITPGLIDNILTQPLARIPSDDAPNLAAALTTLFYLRHLHGDGSGSELKSILATTMTQQQERRAYLAKVAEYDEVWDQIHADPRTQKTANGGYTFSSNYVVPDEPKSPHTEEAIQASVESMNKAVLAALGAKPGETIVAGLIKAGFTNGIADDSGKLAAGGVSATDMAAAPAEDLTPDYRQVKPARPHLPLVNRTWPVEIMVSTGAMNPTLVKSQEKGAIYRVGKFQFEAGSQLSLPVVKEIARIFTALEELVERMPWDITPTPANGQWFVAKLYPNLEDYKKIAPPSSGGFYSLKEKVFHVPYQALGLTGGRPDGSAVNGVNSDTLVHELTHMMMDRIIPYVPIWVAEGSAEYVETIPLSNNAMRPADIPQAIKTYVGKMS